jgi:hypothetical protein
VVGNQPSDEAAEAQHSQRENPAAPWRPPSDFLTVLASFIHLSSIAAWRRFARERASAVASWHVQMNALFCRFDGCWSGPQLLWFDVSLGRQPQGRGLLATSLRSSSEVVVDAGAGVSKLARSRSLFGSGFLDRND